MKKNLKKLCQQCKNSPLCRGKEECEHCAKYCEAYGAETKGNMRMASSAEEEVGIAREPQSDFMRMEDDRDTTLVSRFADGAMMRDGMGAGMDPKERLQMVHEPMDEERMGGGMVMENHREHEGYTDGIMMQNHQESRYYTASIIKPGLLMNIMLKLINIKEINEIEKVVVLVKSKKSVPVTLEKGDEIEMEFLKTLGKELETTEKIHGKSQLDSKDINKILETAYEKGQFKSKSQTHIVSEADTIPMIYNEKITRKDKIPDEFKTKSEPHIVSESDTIPMIPHEKITRFQDKIVSSPNEMVLKTHKIEQENEDNNERNMMVSQSIPEVDVLGTSNLDASKINNMERQEGRMESGKIENMGVKLEREGENSMEMDSDSDQSLEENEKARTFHHKKKKIKHHKKKEYKQPYRPSYGSSYDEPYGYYRSNDQQPSNQGEQDTLQINNGEDMELITGAQQQGLKPINEDRINAKDGFEQNSKSYIFKGEGGLLRDLEKFEKSENNDDFIGAQQEVARPLNEDLIGFKDDFGRPQKGFSIKGEGDKLKGVDLTQRTRNNDEIVGFREFIIPKPTKEDLERIYQNNRDKFNDKGQKNPLDDLGKSRNTINDETSTHTHQETIIGTQFKPPKSNKGSIDIDNEWLKNPDKIDIKGQKRPLDDFVTLTNQETENLEDHKKDAHRNSDRKRIDEGIAQIILTEKNKKLDPKKVHQAEPSEDNHDGMPDPFHNRMHAHFKKVQEYYKQQSGKSSGSSQSIVGMTESENAHETNENSDSQDVMIHTRNNENFEGVNENHLNIESDNLKITNNLGAKEETLPEHSPNMEEEPLDDMPKVGINFQPEDLINLQMAKENNINTESEPKVAINIQPQDLIILQKAKDNEHSNTAGEHFELPINSEKNRETPQVRASAPTQNIIVTGDLNDSENPITRPQFGDENLPGQTVIQVDDQLIDVPDDGASIFQVNSQPEEAFSNGNEEEEKMFINQSVLGNNDQSEMEQNVGAMHAGTSENLRVNPQIMKDQSGQNMGLSADMTVLKTEYPRHPIPAKNPLAPSYSFKKEHEFRAPKIYTGNGDMQRASLTNEPEISNIEQELSKPDISPIKKHPFAPVFGGSRAAEIIETKDPNSERSSASEKHEPQADMLSTKSTMNVIGDGQVETVGAKHVENENAIEEKIEKLITPREQEFLHNFGKIVPSIEKMHLNSKSDIYFMGNGIKLPLKMLPNNDGSISLSVDLEKLCKCKNATCAHKIDVINKLDENLMDLTDNYQKLDVSPLEKHENDIPQVEKHTEQKIRRPRNHIDLSKLYKTYRKKYHKLHKRAISNEYFRRFKEIEQGLEKKLDDLNENVKKSNREYDNMLRKGTKDLLQIKEEDQVVKQRIELVNDLLKWMKEMASEVSTNGEDTRVQF